MDFASIIGLIGCFGIIIYGIVGGDQGFSALKSFLDMPSVYITFGGTFMCMLVVSSSIPGFFRSLKTITLVMKTNSQNESDIIHNIITLANTARKEGLLALEEAASQIDDDFLKKGVMLIVDGTDQELVSNILETEINCIERRHNEIISFWETCAAFGPGWGMIGTLIGLINMLKQLDDPSKIGPSMSVALITTLYGSFLANWICTPIANKLKALNAREIVLKEVMVEGVLSIQAGENPRVIEEKLKSFLAPSMRNIITDDKGQGGES